MGGMWGGGRGRGSVLERDLVCRGEGDRESRSTKCCRFGS